MEPKRVVITGMGIISCIGQDLETYWNNLVNGGLQRHARYFRR